LGPRWCQGGCTIVDIGCGPGYATLDLAEIVGFGGRVIAIDRSRRFLDWLARDAAARRLENIDIVEGDLGDTILPEACADFIWCRWLLAFVSAPAAVIEKMVRALKPGGSLMIQEYYDYRSWRLAPATPEIEYMCEVVMKSWRAEGGEPDIGIALPALLSDAGLDVTLAEAVTFVSRPRDFSWQWTDAFVASAPSRLVELGWLTIEEAERIRIAWRARTADPKTLMFSPGVMQLIARKPQ
jgi:SAM-dependent methyltransferase